MDTKYLYLLLNLLTILPIVLLSFDKKVAFYTRWKFLFPAIFIMAVWFIIWDILFTNMGIWGFNDRYLTGIRLINLPLEEWLFFISIPFASVFIYDCFKAYFPFLNPGRAGIFVGYLLAVILLLTGLFYFDRWYTKVTYLLLSAFLIFLARIDVDYLGRFFISFLVILIPFFIVNGILTGSWIEEQVVWYDDLNNMSLRLGTIPVEDIFYGMLLILGNVAIYEWALKWKNNAS